MKFLHRNKDLLNTNKFSESDYYVLSYEELLKVNGRGSTPSGGTTGPTGPTGGGYGTCAGGGAITSGNGTGSSAYGTCAGGGAYTSGNGSNQESSTTTSQTSMQTNTSELAEVKLGWAWILGTKQLPEHEISDDYGVTIERQELNKQLGVSEFHHGVDVIAKEGERINSVYNGIVKDITYSEELGQSVIIEFEDNTRIRYSHCGSINVSIGQSVVAGQQLATVGMTGVTTGPHVHVSYDGDGDGSFYGENYADNPNRVLFPGF